MEAMPSLIEEPTFDGVDNRPQGAVISFEVIAYVSLIVFALVMRVAQLDAVPLTNPEARAALAAWRVVQPDAPGAPLIPESPLLFFLHSLSFTLLGASEFSARIWTALGGVALILSPVLFRDFLGSGRTLIISVMLSFSPVLLVASRTDSPVVWTMLAGVLALWTLWRYYQSGDGRFAIWATSLFLATVLLTDPTGFIFVLILSGAALFALWVTPGGAVDEGEGKQPSAASVAVVRERLATWPWPNALLIGVVGVVLVSTLFMLHPSGLNAIGGLLGAGAGGLTTARPGTPFFFPALVTAFYEPVLLVFSLAALFWLRRRDELTFVERFLVGWFIFGLAASLAYAGTGPEHALWLVLPLTGLASSLVTGLLARVEQPLWWDVPGWSKWVVMIVTIGLLGMFAVHLQSFARALVNSPEGTFQLLNANTASVVWVIISLLFMVIGFFLASSVWGTGATFHGAVLGILAFGLVTSLGSGWRASVEAAHSPVEYWNRQPVSGDVFLLRQTLYELAARQTSGFPQIPVTALVPQDSVVAWVLRDFVNTRFINDPAEAKTQEIVLLPGANEPPDLGGGYVGQPFHVGQTWNPGAVHIADWLVWWLQGRTRLAAVPSDTVVLWLRQDVYNGTPVQPSFGS